MMSLWALTLAMALAPPPERGFDDLLRAFRWERRILLIFGKESSQAVLDQGDRIHARQADADARDLTVLTVVGGIVSNSGSGESLPPAGALRQQFRIDEQVPFTVILIGKDGEEKLRDNRPIAADDLFALIDSMPMRLRESGAAD